MNRKLLVLVAGAACISACRRVPAVAAFQVADSSGVSIASSRAPRWKPGEGWRVDSLPILDIGGAEGPAQAQFTEIAATLLLPNGRVLVAEGSDATLRLFDSAGTPVRTVGRRGQGPGEYQNLTNLRRGGDSLLVWDDELRRLSVLSLDGRYVRSVPVPFKTGRYSFPRLAGRAADGSLIFAAEGGVSSQLPIGAVRDTVAVIRLSADGQRDTLLGRWPWNETMAVTGPRFVSSLTLPYQKHGTMRWSDSGFWIGTADQPQLDAYSGDGRLVRRVRWMAEPVPVTDEELSDWRKKLLARIDTATDVFSAAFRTAYAKARFPDVRPSYRSFLVSVEGELLVQRVPRWDAEGNAGVWDVFGADGEWLGPMTMPTGVTPTELRGDRLLAQWDDADGVARVRVYQVVRVR